jgi:hypothetical protein
MSHFKYQVLELRNSEPQEWIDKWSSRFVISSRDSYDEATYEKLIEKHESLEAEDFIEMGKWKDNARAEGKWKANVASVAYLIWLKAAEELPRCPTEKTTSDFLKEWSERAYTDTYSNGSQRLKRFGLSRATTLLHFISGGKYPIFDSRVKTAFARLLAQPELPSDIQTYLNKVLPLFTDLAEHCGCGTTEYRKLDKALFSYGAYEDPILKIAR